MTLDIEGTLSAHSGYEWWPMTREFICTCEASVGTSYPDPAHRAHVAAVLREQIESAMAEAGRAAFEAGFDLGVDLPLISRRDFNARYASFTAHLSRSDSSRGDGESECLSGSARRTPDTDTERAGGAG